jgi:hypothetical protein
MAVHQGWQPVVDTNSTVNDNGPTAFGSLQLGE